MEDDMKFLWSEKNLNIFKTEDEMEMEIKDFLY